MSRSLRWKFVLVMLVLILLLMTVVCVFLIQGVRQFYTDEFFKQMDNVFSNEELISELRGALDEDAPVDSLIGVMGSFQGKLGIDTETRNYYILDDSGMVVYTSGVDRNSVIEITPNIVRALDGNSMYYKDARANYMDVAFPVTSDGAVSYVIYVRDNKQTVSDISREIFTLIFDAVAVGLAISVALSFILSKTLLSPIIGMTKAAEAIAEGDFSRKLSVESDDEIGILADTFNNMASQLKTTLEEIKKSEALRREFVANVSHELRTPLTSIRSYAETLTDHSDIPREMENDFLHVILNESDRMTKIVQDLLELSRYDAGNFTLAVEEFQPETSVLSVTEAIALEAKKHGHVITTAFESKLPKISGDRARIEQVLLNVLSNAVKYTPDGGSIEITGGRAGQSIWLKIKDTGIGIPAEDLTRIFDRFYRVDKARSRESGGTGLGLSIAREIISRHGGEIRIESTAGVGTAVTITLPIGGPGHDESQ